MDYKTLENLLVRLSKDQKVNFIRTTQSMIWTTLPKEEFDMFPQEKIDNLFKFMYKNTPEKYRDSIIENLKVENNNE